ncbi:T-complex protein 11 [Euphorbia peplus]|nr:T-complex protein 11 [Euphorbia peplus]
MAGVVEMTDPKSMPRGVVLNFPINDAQTTSSFTPPRRLRRRLVGHPKTPLSAEVIQAKLREADLRRQQFHQLLATKAKRKSINPSEHRLQVEDRRQQIEARLYAAEQKRLSILASAQMRLARLDELRKAVKSGAEKRFKEERKELSTKVESRVQQAGEKRRLILESYKQRKAARREQAIRSLRLKMSKKDNYRESVHDAIYQKHAAAERNRLEVLGEKKTRAHSTALQLQQIARSVYCQQETRWKQKHKSEQIEYQLKMAKRKREESLRLRRSLKSHLPANSKMVDREEYSSRKIVRHWRYFVKSRKTTLSLAKAYAALGINEESVKLMPFEQLAISIKSEKTVNTLKALMCRLESRLKLSLAARNRKSSLADIDHILRHLAFSHNKENFSNTIQGEVRTAKSVKKEARIPERCSRYPTRVVLSAYMIMGHPNAVLNRQAESEIVLAESAVNFIRQFELLVNRILDGPVQASPEKIGSDIPKQMSIRSQLESFDQAWCSYLHNLVAWKSKDAKLLEEDLVRAACQLEFSIMQPSKMTYVDDGVVSRYMEAFRKQVMDEQKLLREQVLHVAGNAGVKRMERALAEMRTKFVKRKEPESSFKASTLHISPSLRSHGLDQPPVPISVETDCSVSENELLVNEIIHTHHQGFAESLNAMDKDHDDVKEKLRETMEKAFWDSVTESINQDEPDFSWILKLMKEVRDELCEMSPQKWRQEIIMTIDVDNLSQVLKSGTLDMESLGKKLEFALGTLQKLSAPVNDEETKSSHTKLLRELGEISKSGETSIASLSLSVIKGLRFVLEEIQALKKEISKARVKFVEPLIKGPAGVEYLKKSFVNRYGPPTDAQSSLKLTSHWLSSVIPHVEQEWDEYKNSLTALPNSNETSQVLPTTLRTGGAISRVSELRSPVTVSNELECKGERVEKLVRLGLLKLASGVKGLTLEALPETLKLNLARLRAVQSQYQNAIVIATCILIFRQMLVSEKLLSNALGMENIFSECHKKLSKLLDSLEDIGISEIVATMFESLKEHNHMIDAEKLQGKEKVMENMLGKSLQGEDAVFKRVSHCVYLAFRACVFGGNGYRGRQLVVSVLQRTGASFLADRVHKAAEVLAVVGTVSRSVHGEWYEELLRNM